MAVLSKRILGQRRNILVLMLALAVLALVWWWPGDGLTLRTVTFPRDGMIVVDVVNRGGEPLRVAQVLVDGAFWQFAIEPDATLRPGGRATLRIPYPWVADEPHHIALLTDRGTTFERVVAANQRPTPWHIPTLLVLLVIGGVAGMWLLWRRFMSGKKDSS